jgi:hydrogenase nickel incorporation protein HypA/HybF
VHELGIVQQVVELAAERTHGARVKRLVLEIGRLSMVMPDALRFCFDLATAETTLESAELQIVEVDGSARCRACGGVVTLARPIGRCACGCSDLEWLSGTEVRIIELEVS